MNENELFRLALGLAAPWQVKSLEFSAEKKRLDIRFDFPKGSQFPCPECGRLCGAYDTEDRTWRHLNFFNMRPICTRGSRALHARSIK